MKRTVATPAGSAAQSAENLNNDEAPKPLTAAAGLPRSKQWLATETLECQRRSPLRALQLDRAPAAEEAKDSAARSRCLQSHACRQSLRRSAAAGTTAASPSRVIGRKMTVTTEVARAGSRFGNRVKVVFGACKASWRSRAVLPNPSLKRSANGRPPAPGRWYAVHFHRPGAGVLPSSPA
jgi:hypothetical protein